MGHSFIKLRNQRIDEPDARIVLASGFISSVVAKCPPRGPGADEISGLIDDWQQEDVYLCPGCVDMRLDKHIKTEAGMTLFDEAVVDAMHYANTFGEVIPEESLIDIVAHSKLPFGNIPVKNVLAVLADMRSLIASVKKTESLREHGA